MNSGGSTSACAPPQEISVRPLSVTRNFDDLFLLISSKASHFLSFKTGDDLFLLISSKVSQNSLFQGSLCPPPRFLSEICRLNFFLRPCKGLCSPAVAGAAGFWSRHCPRSLYLTGECVSSAVYRGVLDNNKQ